LQTTHQLNPREYRAAFKLKIDYPLVAPNYAARCPTDTVVWVNTRSRVYHFAGTHNYGHTKEAACMCESEAKAAGDRAAMNKTHP
jgi:hypothetical protein